MKTTSRRSKGIQQKAQAPKQLPIPAGFALLQVCFFLSGAAGLIYQVAWTKSLGLLFGYTAYATATGIAVFMGGLALGSFLLGKWCESRSDSVRVYALLEFGVGVTGALSITGLAGVRVLYLHAHAILSSSAIFLIGFRVVGAALVLGVPSFLMGGTLPVLVRGVVRHAQELGARVSRFYAINTLGAVAGTLAAGFVLLPAIGLRLTILAACLLNFVAGAVAYGIARRESSPDLAATKVSSSGGIESPDPEPDKNRFLLAAFAVVGFTAIAYEIAWTRLLATFLGSSTYSFTLMLATFLLGIVVGSAIFAKTLQRKRRVTVATFAWTQTATASAALLFLFFFRALPELIPPILRATKNGFTGMVLAQFVTCALAMLPAAIVFGFNFPAVVTLVAGAANAERAASSVGRAYAANTAGAIAGALTAGFLLLPRVGSFRLIALLAGVNVLLAVLLWFRQTERNWIPTIVNAAILLLLIYVGGSSSFYSRAVAGFSAVLYGNYHDQRLTVEEIANTEDVVFFEDGVNATISVTRSEDYVALKTNGKVDASNLDSSTQLLLGDLGAIFHPYPRRVLVIGLGGGMTASAVSRFSDVERIDCVEIESAVFRAQTALGRLNRGVLADPRFHLIFDDARNFLQTTQERYDLIISEPSNPWIAGIAALYTTEFYAAVRERLNAGGMFVQWVQAYGLATDDFRMIVGSLNPHFADVSLWRSGGRDYLLLARAEKGELSFERSRKAWGDPLLNQDFRSLQLAAPESWPAYFRLGDAQLRTLANGADLNTDDRTLLEYRAPKRLLSENLTHKLEEELGRLEVSPILPGLNVTDLAMARIAAAESALDLNDTRARRLVQDVEKVAPVGRVAYLSGRVALLENRLPDAIRLLKQAEETDTNRIDILYWLAVNEVRFGLNQQAESHLEQILKRVPRHKEALRALVRISEDAGNWDKAIGYQRRLIESEIGTDAGGSCKLGDLYLRKRDLNGAEQPLRDGLQRDGYAFLCHRDLGELLRATNRLAEAEVELQFVVKYFPEADPKTFASLALLYQAQSRSADGEKVLAKGRRIFPQDEMLKRMKLN